MNLPRRCGRLMIPWELLFWILYCHQTVMGVRVPVSPQLTIQESPHDQERGGNLTIVVIGITGLPQTDVFGIFSGQTDPYVEISISGTTRRTRYVQDSLSPTWPNGGETLYFGNKVSGSDMTIRVMDADDGLEMGDDEILTYISRVMDCSCFTSDTTGGTCTKERCVEEAWIPLSDDADCSGRDTWPWETPNYDHMCMHVRVEIVPFQLTIHEIYEIGGEESFAITTAGVKRDSTGQGTDGTWGRPYRGNNEVLDYGWPNFGEAGKGLMLQTNPSDKTRKDPDPFISVSVNMDATIFLFIQFDDLARDDYPTWVLTNTSWVSSTARAAISFSGGQGVNEYEARQMVVPAGSIVTLGYPAIGRVSNPLSMYFLTATMLVDADPVIVQDVTYFGPVMLLMIELLAVTIYFGALLLFTLLKANFRLDRIDTVLLQSSAHGPDRNIIAFLFASYGNKTSKDNVLFRRNLFYTKVGASAVLMVWPASVVTYGLIAAATAQPTTFGLAVLFVGVALCLLYFGFVSWRNHHWRMTRTVIITFGSVGISFYLFAFFSVVIAGQTQNVLDAGSIRIFTVGERAHQSSVDLVSQYYSLFSVTAVALTGNMCILLWVLFIGDSKLREAYAQLNAMSSALVNQQTSPSDQETTEDSTAWTKLLSPAYSLDHSMPEFKYSAMMGDIFCLPDSVVKSKSAHWYRVSLFMLAVYSIIALVICKPNERVQGIGVSIAVLILDHVVFLLRRGPCKWSTTKYALLCFLGRASLTLWTGDWWIVGVGQAYLIFGFALGVEIIERNLSFMSKEEASAVSFFGRDPDAALAQHRDVSVRPQFALGYLSMTYLVVLLGFVFTGSDASKSSINIFGSVIPLWLPGVLAFILVLVFTVLGLARRSVQLQVQGMLRDDSYLAYRWLDLPIQLLLFAELIVIMTAFLVYFVTASVAVLICSIFVPILAGTGLKVYMQWVANDFNLLEHPSKRVLLSTADDLKQARKKGGRAMGQLFSTGAGKMAGAGGFLKHAIAPFGKGGANKVHKVSDPVRLRELLGDDTEVDAAKPGFEDVTDGPTGVGGTDKPSLPKNKLSGQPVIESDMSLRSITSDSKLKSTHESTDESVKLVTVNESGDDKKEMSEKEGKTDGENKEKGKEEKEDGGKKSKDAKLKDKEALKAKRALETRAMSIRGRKRISPMTYLKTLFIDVKKMIWQKVLDYFKVGLETDPIRMTATEAFFRNKLTHSDYAVLGNLAIFLFLLLAFGLVFPILSEDYWWGHLIWAGPLSCALIVISVRKFFGTQKWTKDMYLMVVVALMLEFLCAWLILDVSLANDLTSPYTLLVVTVALGWPWLTYIGGALAYWADNDWAISRIVARGLPIAFLFGLIGIMEAFFWLGVRTGVIAFVLYLFAMIFFRFTKIWAQSEFYIPATAQFIFNGLMYVVAVACFVTSMLVPDNLDKFLSLSIGAACIGGVFVGELFKILASIPHGVPIFFSPFVFPVFVYEPKKGTIAMENGLGKAIYGTFLTMLIWGVFVVVLVDPIDIGIGIVCAAMFIVAGATIYIISTVPSMLSVAMLCVDTQELRVSAEQAVQEFELRKQAIEITCEQMDPQLAENQRLMKTLNRYASQKTLKKNKLVLNNPRYSVNETVTKIKRAEDRLWNTKVGRRRRDAPYTWANCFTDIWFEGTGPFAILSGGGWMYGAYKMYKNPGRMSKVYAAGDDDPENERADWLDDLIEVMGPGGDEMTVMVYDHDVTSFDDLLGSVTIPLDEMVINTRTTAWYNLFDPEKAKIRSSSSWKVKKNNKAVNELKEGEEKVGMETEIPGQIAGSKTDEEASTENKVDEQNGGESSKAEEAVVDTVNVGEEEEEEVPEANTGKVKTPQVKLSIQVRVVAGTLLVYAQVHKARNLRAADKNGMSDPYCVVTCGDFTQKTAVVPKQLDPNFSETRGKARFTFPPLDDTLMVEMKDQDMFRSESLGGFSVSLHDLKPGVESIEWHVLTGGNGTSAATGKVRLALTLSAPLIRGGLSASQAKLHVVAVCAKGLRAADRGGTSDPYMICRCGSNSFRTSTQKKTLAPVWNEEFAFNEAGADALEKENKQDEDEDDENFSTEQIDAMDSWKLYVQFPTFDRNLDLEFMEETRLGAFFQVLLVVASQARVAKEATLFNRFLRESRFKLLANDISPPASVFQSQSWASADVSLVATWLSFLSYEQRSRFNELKWQFTQEQFSAEQNRIVEEYQLSQHAGQVLAWQQQFDYSKTGERAKRFLERKQRRILRGVAAEEHEESEDLTNIKELLDEIESGELCVPGENGKRLQFSDPEFPVDDEKSLYGIARRGEVEGWRSVTGLNPDAQLFAGGTDPDDIFTGYIQDSWFLSAVAILAASGDVGDGEIDPLIANLFIIHDKTESGAYGVKFYRNGQWESTVVDDFLPLRADPEHTDPAKMEDAGVACAYSKHMNEFWVAVLEKAYAKHYGGYRYLENGYVHHALTAMTGCMSEEIHLLSATQGSAKLRFWKRLVTLKNNGFLLGGGSITSQAATAEQLDSGLVFGACYVIYDVRTLDGNRLLKLRNPPGNHGEWAGDWGDKSPLWTKRKKAKLGWSDEDDGTFWISYDDFVLNFRSLYVCHYFDETKWLTNHLIGTWIGKQTAMGLPHTYNPDCRLSENPQWTIEIDRPMDIHIKVSQTLEGETVDEAHPFSIVLLRTNYDREDKRLHMATTATEISQEKLISWTGNPEMQRERHLSVSLMPGNYTLLVATYMPDQEGHFEVFIHSKHDIRIHQIFPDLRTWQQKRESSLVVGGFSRSLTTIKASFRSEKPKLKRTEKKKKTIKGVEKVKLGSGAVVPENNQEEASGVSLSKSNATGLQAKTITEGPSGEEENEDIEQGAGAAGEIKKEEDASKESDPVVVPAGEGTATEAAGTEKLKPNASESVEIKPDASGANDMKKKEVEKKESDGTVDKGETKVEVKGGKEENKPDWIMKLDPTTNAKFYLNQRTGESSWSKPPTFISSSPRKSERKSEIKTTPGTGGTTATTEGTPTAAAAVDVSAGVDAVATGAEEADKTTTQEQSEAELAKKAKSEARAKARRAFHAQPKRVRAGGNMGANMGGAQQQQQLQQQQQQFQQQQQQQEQAGMGSEWVQQVDPSSGHPYWYNTQTGESQWIQ